MSTRVSDITRESDLAQESFVDTQDLDPDPANGLKNENQQKGEIRNRGPVRQQPITVPINDQPGGIRGFLDQQVITPIQDFFNRNEDDPFQTQQIVTRPGSSQPTQQFNTGPQFNPLDLVPEAAPGFQFRDIDPSFSLPPQEPREFTIEQTGFTSEADIIQDPFTGRMQSQTQVTPVDRGVLTEGQEIALETIGLVGIPGVGRAGQAINTRALRFPERVRGLPIRAERFGERAGRLFGESIPQTRLGNRGTLQLGEFAQRGQQIARGAQRTIRGGDILPSPGQVRPNPGQIINQRPLGSGGQPIGANRLQVARELDLAIQSAGRQRQAIGQATQIRPGALDFIRQAQQPQVRQQTTAQPSITVSQQPGVNVGPFDQITVGDQIQRVQQAQQPNTLFGQDLPAPNINQLLSQAGPRGGFDQFNVQRQLPGQQNRVDTRFGPIQTQISNTVQRQPPGSRQRGDTRFPPINPTIPDPTGRTPPGRGTNVPGRNPRIPGIPPVPIPFGGGGGGAPRGFGRRGFPFGRIREFSPAFPGTSFRVLPDGTVVLDLDPGERRRSNTQQPRDPNTGQFVSSGG